MPTGPAITAVPTTATDPASPILERIRVAVVTTEADAGLWDAYVESRTATVTDLSAWSLVIAEAYGIRSHLLVARAGAEIVGVLGLHEIRHPVFGHYLTTAAFGNDGGFHYDRAAARDALLEEAGLLAERLRVAYLVIRSREERLPGLQADSSYVAAELDLSEGAEAVWARLPSKTRNQVRRGRKEGFTVSSGPDQIDAFFDVFHEHMRDLGSPAHSRRYYRSIQDHLGERADFLVVRDGATVVAGALLFRVNGTAMNMHTVALRKFNRRCPNYLLYWTMIERSCAHGCRRFDMGRSRADSPQLQFKSNWGTTELPLHYHFLLQTLQAPPDLDPRNPRFRLATAVWQRLPLWVTRLVGPRLIPGVA